MNEMIMRSNAKNGI